MRLRSQWLVVLVSGCLGVIGVTPGAQVAEARVYAARIRWTRPNQAWNER